MSHSLYSKISAKAVLKVFPWLQPGQGQLIIFRAPTCKLLHYVVSWRKWAGLKTDTNANVLWTKRSCKCNSNRLFIFVASVQNEKCETEIFLMFERRIIWWPTGSRGRGWRSRLGGTTCWCSGPCWRALPSSCLKLNTCLGWSCHFGLHAHGAGQG